MTPEYALKLQASAWIAVGVGVLLLLYLLSPILTPFLLALILAYISSPLMDKLVAHRVPRVLASVFMVLLVIAVVTALVLILLPLVRREAAQITERLPELLTMVNDQLLPWLKRHFGINIKLDANAARKFFAENWSDTSEVAKRILASLGVGGLALFSVAVNMILAPVVLFYLLNDWPRFVSRLAGVIPRPWHAKATQILGDVDKVLSEFLRGQISVMLLLAIYYSCALWFAGMDSALPVGLVTGLLIFIPYVGFFIGFSLALIVALLQPAEGLVLWVLGIYGCGNVLEGFMLTPFLVGERIGLHPLAVIFALLAFGQLFGFFGVLAALPTSAALLVALREVRKLYLDSRFYRG